MSVSTHVLDTMRGNPAAGVAVALNFRRPNGDWSILGHAVTDANGRVKEIGGRLEAGEYRLDFATGAYFKSFETDAFYPEVSVMFAVAEGETHVHVPLLLSPYGYSTYKGL
jgi:5-hydroxyisourate hydrolase